MTGTDPRARAALSSAERAGTFHKSMEAWNARDMDAMFAVLADEVVLRTDPNWPGGGEFRGRDEISRFATEFIEPWDDVRYEIVGEAVDVGDRLVERGRWSATGHSSGIHGTIDFSSVIAFDGPLVARMDVFLDHDDALAFAIDPG